MRSASPASRMPRQRIRVRRQHLLRREGEAPIHGLDAAEHMFGLGTEHRTERRIIQCTKTLALFRARTPDHGNRARLGKRQQRHRPGRAESLPSDATMRLLGPRHGGNGTLLTVPWRWLVACTDASKSAHATLGTIRSHDQLGADSPFDAVAIAYRESDCAASVTVQSRHRGGQRVETTLRRPPQRIHEDAVLHHPGERISGAESQPRRAVTFPDAHFVNRRETRRFNARQVLQKTHGSRSQRNAANVEAKCAAHPLRHRAFDQHDAPASVGKRQGRSRADDAAAHHRGVVDRIVVLRVRSHRSHNRTVRGSRRDRKRQVRAGCATFGGICSRVLGARASPPAFWFTMFACGRDARAPRVAAAGRGSVWWRSRGGSQHLRHRMSHTVRAMSAANERHRGAWHCPSVPA